jgi:cytochrome d ubiquinol oxidase subunit I
MDLLSNIDTSLVNWSRAQFALTAMYHWIFVPLTLGLSFIIAIMETLYVKTGDEHWKKITKFWMSLFGINFAIGVATGIILEFEFGTNWSNYSWFVGDIFGAPLAIEGIMAFFMESTFIAVMFFGWEKVSKKMHLVSSWLVAVGSNLSALWILVANAWMQNPVGTEFNPATARNEMVDFWAVLFSPTAINKFLHTITSGYVLASIFVMGVSAWFLLKKRRVLMAKRSILIAAIFGFISSLYLAFTGDGSAYQVAQTQPMKLAAMEGLYHGTKNAPLTIVGALKQTPPKADEPESNPFVFNLNIPVLSNLAYHDSDAFVPGVYDLVHGNEKEGIQSYTDRIAEGKIAIQGLKDYKAAQKSQDEEKAAEALVRFKAHYKNFGYGYYDDPNDLIPNVPLVFYSFHIMVALGMMFMGLFLLAILSIFKGWIENWRWFQYILLWSIPLAFIAQQCGWIVAEVGRQPWVVQDLMPTLSAVSNINKSNVMITFFLFLFVFTILFIAEVKIMLSAIKKESLIEGDQ